MSKSYKIKASEKLFNEWMRVSASPHSKIGFDTWTIVQNDMTLSGEELNEWYKRAGDQIEETEKHFAQVIEDMKAMRKRTVDYIKFTNGVEG